MVLGQLLHEVFQRVLLIRMEEGTNLSGSKLINVVKEQMQNVFTSIDTLNQL